MKDFKKYRPEEDQQVKIGFCPFFISFQPFAGKDLFIGATSPAQKGWRVDNVVTNPALHQKALVL